MGDGAGRVLKECFCLPSRATLRKLRPEDMFETWVSTGGWEAFHPLLASNKKLLLKSFSLRLGKTFSFLPCKATFPPLGRRESLGCDAQCLSLNNVLEYFAQQLTWVPFAPQGEQGKLIKCARRVLSLCSGRDTATESILPEDAPSHLMGIGAGGGVISVVCSLGELRRWYRRGDSWKLYQGSCTIQNASKGRQFS